MALLADAKASLFDKEFSKRDQLPLSCLAIGISAVCVALALTIGQAALNAVTGLGGALLALFGAKFGLIDRERFKRALKALEEEKDG